MHSVSQMASKPEFVHIPRRRNAGASDSSRVEVKSATRVLDIQEFFKSCRRPGRCKEIAEYLDIPASSTNELLKTLMSMGYLLFDSRSKEYYPSPMIYTLGSWWNTADAGANRIYELLLNISDSTGESATLSIQTRWSVQFVCVVQRSDRPQLQVCEGDKVPLLQSAAGIAMLSNIRDDEMVKIVRRCCGYGFAPAKTHEEGNEMQQIVEFVRRCRKRGYVAHDNRFDHSLHGIAIALPRDTHSGPMAICVGGPKDDIIASQATIVQVMRSAIARFWTPGATVNPSM